MAADDRAVGSGPQPGGFDHQGELLGWRARSPPRSSRAACSDCACPHHGHEPHGPGFDWPVGFGAATIGATFASLPDLEPASCARLSTASPCSAGGPRPGGGGGRSRRRCSNVSRAGPRSPRSPGTSSARASSRPGRRRTRGSHPPPARPDVPPDRRRRSRRARGLPRAPGAARGAARLAEEPRVPLGRARAGRAADRRFGELPGRAVCLTFDDGYQDFAEVAWPLLQRYGFGATVFLVADLVARAVAWDAHHGPPAPLMGWATVGRLARRAWPSAATRRPTRT